jgi:steroid 5-alpha reductase family enzyme
MADASMPWPALGQVWAVMIVVMSLAWLWQRRTRNATVVDAAWSAGMGGAAVYFALVAPGAPAVRLLVGLLGGLWGLRLCLMLLGRAFGEAEEDGRYRYLREHWQDHQGKWFGFFQAQALLVALFALPFAGAAWSSSTPSTGWLVASVVVWLISVGGETIADRQLTRFRRDPANRGHTCRRGLWRYSRHPNYFFEWLHWFVYPLLAIGSPWWWLTAIGPVLMLFSLYRVTGIPYTEAQALRSRGEDYRRYQRDTSAFIPWFPKRSESDEHHG